MGLLRISSEINWEILNSYPAISPTTNVAQTRLSILSLVAGHSLCQANVHQDLALNFWVCFLIFCEATPGPSTTQGVSFLFIVLMYVVYLKYIILSVDPIWFLVTFHISPCGNQFIPCSLEVGSQDYSKI